MKKQFLLLFAASALFAACSSDEMPNSNEVNNGQEQTEIENYPSSCSVTTEEGLGMSVGALNTKATTRIGEGEVYFTLEIPDDVLGQWKEYVVQADDFAIRRDGEYQTIKPIEGENSANWGKIKITGNELTVQAEGLQIDVIAAGKEKQPEITFEAYLWIENEKEAFIDGKETFVERFTYNDKLAWIGAETVDKDTERGMDVTTMVAEDNGAVLHSTIEPNQAQPSYGYAVRYNVYRGLQGQQFDAEGNKDDETGLGNTPYIKVSIHVNQMPNDFETQVIPVYPEDED